VLAVQIVPFARAEDTRDPARVFDLPRAVDRVLRDVLPQTGNRVIARIPGFEYFPGTRAIVHHQTRRYFMLANDLTRPQSGWWLATAQLTIGLDPSSGAGQALVSIGSDGRTWGQIVIRKRADGLITWNTLDIVRGTTNRRSHVATFVVPIVNFPSLQALHGGRNALKLGVQELGHLRIKRIATAETVFLHTDLSPEPLSLTASVKDLKAVHVGDTVKVPYTIRNGNSTPIRQVRLNIVQPAPDGVRLDRSVIPSVISKTAGNIYIHATRAGELRFSVTATTATARDGVQIEIAVQPRSRGDSWKVRALIGLGAFALVLASGEGAWLILARLRR
jgi:hypothetical protein